MGLACSSSKSVRGDWEDNRCKQHNVSNSALVANIHATPNSVVSHGGYGFSLPWYRLVRQYGSHSMQMQFVYIF